MAERLTQEEAVRQAMKYEDALTAYAYALVRDWSLAQDVVQQAMMVVMRKHGEFDAEGGSIYAWIRSIVRFEALHAVRSRRREVALDDELLDLVEKEFVQEVDDAAALRMRDEAAALHDCMESLPEAVRETMLGFYRDKMSCERLGTVLGRSANAIRVLLSRTRARLRGCVEKKMSVSAEAAV